MRKFLLINPSTGIYDRADRCQAPIEKEGIEMVRPPMDLAYLAAMVEKAGQKAIIRDYPAEGRIMADFRKELKKFKPEFLVLSVTTPTLKADLESCTVAKKINPKIITIAKGAHFYEFDQEVLANFKDLDVAIRGESEEPLLEIAQGKKFEEIKGLSFRKGKQIMRNKERPFLANLDDLPLPARHLLNKELYRFPDTNLPYALILTGRGCPGSCVFCLVGKVSGKKLRMRSVESVLKEIEVCLNDYNLKTFFFRADTFTWKKEWVIEFCQALIKRKLKIRWGTNSRVDTVDEEMISLMKQVGCDIIGFGVESGSEKILKKMKKGTTLTQARQAVRLCQKYGVKTLLFFILGMPWEDKRTIKETINFAKELPGTFYTFSLAYPFPGTELAKMVEKNNLLAKDSLDGFDYARPAVRTFFLTNRDLIFYRKKALREVCFRPSYVFRVLSQVKSAREFKNYLFAGLKKTKEWVT